MAAQTKTLYHGELREAGPTRVTVKSDILESKKKKDTYYVTLIVNGVERYYHPENDACLQFWDGQKGKTFTVIAEGTHEEATITYVGEPAGAAAPAQQPTQQNNRAAKSTTPATRQTAAHPSHEESDRALTGAKLFVARRASLMKITLKATHALAAEWQKVHNEGMPLELFQSVNASFFIDASRAFMADKLPVNVNYSDLTPVRKEGAPAAAQPPPPPPKPKCEKHGIELNPDGTCAHCVAELAQQEAAKEEDDVPF